MTNEQLEALAIYGGCASVILLGLYLAAKYLPPSRWDRWNK